MARAGRSRGRWMASTVVAVALCGASPALAQGEAAPPNGPLPFDFARVTDDLDRAVDVLDEMDDLERSRWFGRDQRDAERDIDAIIEDALALLDVNGASELRDDVRRHEARIRAEHERIADLRRRRVSAPTEAELSLLDRATLTTTREGIDRRIAAAQTEIEVSERAIEESKAELVDELNRIGLTMSRDGADAMLTSVTGDDYLRMAVVFDNFRLITGELEQLVEQSAEAPEQSRRYYGMYVILVRMLAGLELEFIDKVNEQYLPELERLAERAREATGEAEAGLRRNRGNPELAETYRRNIASNRLTYDVAQDYAVLLRSQASTVNARHSLTSRQLEAAENTFRTVTIGAGVAELIGRSRSGFDALINLQMPEMRQFENQRVREEFERLSRQLQTN